MQGLADLLGTSAERLTALIPAATQATSLDDYLADLLTPLVDGQVPARLPPFIASLARGVVAFDALAFNAAEILAVAAIPQAFGISDPRHLSLADLQTFTLFKELVRQFDNKSAGLIDYLRRPPDTTLPGPTTLALSALSHWPPAQIATLERRFWPTQPAPMGPGTVRGLTRLAACFAIGASTGLEIATLLRIDGLGYLPATDAKGVIPANWRIYTDIASATQAAVNAKFGDADFACAGDGVCQSVSQQRRDALLGYTIWLLGQTLPEIDSPDTLYQYLLIDVEMGGCDTTSYIAQAIAAIQLYMQRCRLMLEPGVTDLSNIPEVWGMDVGLPRLGSQPQDLPVPGELPGAGPAQQADAAVPGSGRRPDADRHFGAFGVAGLPGLLPGRERRGRPDQRLGLLVPAAAARHLGGAEPGHGHRRRLPVDHAGSGRVAVLRRLYRHAHQPDRRRRRWPGQHDHQLRRRGRGLRGAALDDGAGQDHRLCHHRPGDAGKAVPGRAQQYRAGGVLHAQP